jgi:hypothetical protein
LIQALVNLKVRKTLLPGLLQLENALRIDIVANHGKSILKFQVQCFAEDIPFQIVPVNYWQMTHWKYLPAAQIGSFALLGRLRIYGGMRFQMKLMLQQRCGTEMGMVRGKPINRSTSPLDYFHCW